MKIPINKNSNGVGSPWGSFLSEQLHKWKTGEIEIGCRDMAIHVRQIVKEEIERDRKARA